MVHEHFSPRMREAVAQAGAEARDLGHGSVTDGHLLLGLLQLRRGTTARLLKRARLRLDPTRAAIGTRPRESETAGEDLRVGFSGKRALQLSLHEAFERNDGPIRAAYLLLGIIEAEADGVAAIRAQNADPIALAEAARDALPPTDPKRGRELLEGRLAGVEAFLAAGEKPDAVSQVLAEAADLDVARTRLAALLELPEEAAGEVATMPLDMLSPENREALAVERDDLRRRLGALR